MKRNKVAIALVLTLVCYWTIAELATHFITHQKIHSKKISNSFFQRVYIYTDINRFMDKKNHKDLNSDSIRFHREAADIAPEDTSIIFLGNSFMYGFLLSHRAAMPYQFEEIARQQFPGKTIHGINFGWVSASPYIELNLLKKLGKKYAPDVVILDIDMNDFHNDVYYQTVHEKKSIYWFSDKIPFSTSLLEEMLRSLFPDDLYEKITGVPKSQLYFNERPIEQSLPYLKNYTEKNIDALYEYTTKELGAKFIVFVNPKTFHYNEKEAADNWLKDTIRRTPYSFEIFKYIDELSKTKPYPVISLLPAFQQTTVFPTAFERDAHWNRAGYKVAATAMVEECKKLGCFTDAPPAPRAAPGD